MTTLDIRNQLAGTATKSSCRSILCWGSAGSGKSSLAVNLSFELAHNGWRVCLIDADTYHPSLAALLGITQSNGGLASCLRLVRQGRFDEAERVRLVKEVSFSQNAISVIAGIPSQTRWSEIDPQALAGLAQSLSEHFDFLIWDVASYNQPGLICTESGKDRNQATSYLLQESDLVLATFLADAAGLNRFLFDLREVGRQVWPVANRLRSSALGRNPQGQLRSILSKTSNVSLFGEISEDEGFDIMLRTTRPLLLQGRSSKALLEIRKLAQEITMALSE
ncbi:MAG: hypothetical protein RL537_614 [Actinomycetota bacterium]|jgi:hypothetical protein